VNLKSANVFQAQPVGRLAEISAELRDCASDQNSLVGHDARTDCSVLVANNGLIRQLHLRIPGQA
jgi:hypothetical protein